MVGKVGPYKYYLTANGLVRFRNKIYVLYISELKKLILREFHVKSYSGLLGIARLEEISG